MFTWQFSSQKERSAQWYIIALVVVLFFVLYGIIEQIYFLSVVSFLFAWVYILMENNATPITHVNISEHIVQVNTTIYEFDKINKFALLSNGTNYVMLRLFLKKWITQMIDIPLTEEVDSIWLKDFLSEKILFDADADWGKWDRLIHAMRL